MFISSTEVYSADVFVGGKVAGQLGILHPEVLPCFELNMPLSSKHGRTSG